MKEIDIAAWDRREQFDLYRQMDFPYFNLTATIHVGRLSDQAKAMGSTFTIALVYILSRAANEIPAFRTRIRGERVVQHGIIHPSITVLSAGDRLGFCTIPFTTDFSKFSREAAKRIDDSRRQPSLQDPPGADDLLFMTSIPWVNFSGLIHPVPLNPPDSIPRIAWGKVADEDGRDQLPLSVQCHHAVMDGVHIGRYYEKVQGMLAEPLTKNSD